MFSSSESSNTESDSSNTELDFSYKQKTFNAIDIDRIEYSNQLFVRQDVIILTHKQVLFFDDNEYAFNKLFVPRLVRLFPNKVTLARQHLATHKLDIVVSSGFLDHPYTDGRHWLCDDDFLNIVVDNILVKLDLDSRFNITNLRDVEFKMCIIMPESCRNVRELDWKKYQFVCNEAAIVTIPLSPKPHTLEYYWC